MQKPRLKPGAVPCIFPNNAPYFSKIQNCRESPASKKARLEAEAIKVAITESEKSILDHKNKFCFRTFAELSDRANLVNLSEHWNVIKRREKIIYLYLNLDKAQHEILYIVINSSLTPSVFLRGVEIFPRDGLNNVNSVLDIEQIIQRTELLLEGDETLTVNVISNLIDSLKSNDKNEKTLSFLQSQIQLCLQSKFTYRFQPETMVISSMLLFISPHAYKFLRKTGIIVLPCPNTVKKLCAELSPSASPNDNFLAYIREKQQSLKLHECFVSLMLDEIHIKPYLDYKGGSIVGTGHDGTDLATTAHVFMIQSLLCDFKDVVHILPVHKTNGSNLFSVIHNVVIGLEAIGFKIIVIVTDNNSINKKAVSYFANPPQVSIVYPNPVDKKRPLFFLNDSVHIFKCIRNNWINLRNLGSTFCFPDFDDPNIVRYASFSSIRDLYNIEHQKLLKFGYGLSVKALWPSTFERQNVKLVAQIFNERIECSLLELGPENNIQNYLDTSKFISIITTWWNIVNVKTPLKGLHRRNEMQKPLTNDEFDTRCAFLNKFLLWLDKWESIDLEGKLTKETHCALKLTTYGFLQLKDYCFNELKLSYLLPGKIQTDSLEARFGRYRQLSGSQYHVSLRQIFESEKKLKLLSTLELSMRNNRKTKITITHLGDDVCQNLESSENDVNSSQFQIAVVDSDFKKIESDIPVLTYIAGYCCHSILKKYNCDTCKDMLVADKGMNISNINDSERLISKMDRGGLKFPREFPVHVVMYSFIILTKLLTDDAFLKVNNQRITACRQIINKIKREDVFFQNENVMCSQHPLNQTLNKIVFISVNIVLNNFCKLKTNTYNENLQEKSKNRKNRKLAIVSKK